MKTRSALLLVFMIVVPAAAMFSHRIPADVRRAIREQMGRLTAAVLPAKPAPARAGGAAALGPAIDPPGVAAVPASAPALVAATGAVVVAPAPVDPRPASAELTRLGAIGFECRPLAGGGGAHVASCSVPLDGSGQLMRVFHVTGGDARSAAIALLDDVASWRHRAGMQRAAAEPVGAGDRSLRF
jgi:hypothetical protein